MNLSSFLQVLAGAIMLAFAATIARGDLGVPDGDEEQLEEQIGPCSLTNGPGNSCGDPLSSERGNCEWVFVPKTVQEFSVSELGFVRLFDSTYCVKSGSSKPNELRLNPSKKAGDFCIMCVLRHKEIPYQMRVKTRKSRLSLAAGLSVEAVKTIIRASSSQLVACFDNVLSKKDIKENVVLSWDVGLGGKTSNITIVQTSVEDLQIRNCFVASIERWKFPQPSTRSVKVKYQTSFSVD